MKKRLTREEYLSTFEERRKKVKKMLREGYSQTEIAGAMGVTPAAIKQLIDRMEAKQ